ncbi:MAG: transglycosylase domain-containing protein [Gammaproteobacteria bacterium]
MRRILNRKKVAGGASGRNPWPAFLILLAVVSWGLWLATEFAMRPLPASLEEALAGADRVQLLDRNETPLSVTYRNRWNVHDRVALHETPPFLIDAFIRSEDKRFYRHDGIDWRARLHALYQNVVNLKTVRGASTLGEQVVKMLHPRPRTLWSRWLEGWEARRLEASAGKPEILQFYLNQVPYAANRRGVKQAARYYFDRDLDTLSRKEMLALAVLVRAPSRLDIRNGGGALERAIHRLGSELLTQEDLAVVVNERFELKEPEIEIEASHFIRHVFGSDFPSGNRLVTTLDGGLQTEFQGLLDQRLKALAGHHVDNAALLAADHQTGEILAWVVAGAGRGGIPGSMIDAVTAPRQPGSSLKPFLYAMALDKGWTAATKIDDSPLSEAVGYGLHQYQNYSRVFYGPVSLREALGNSLNIPALRAVQFVGAQAYLGKLAELGFDGLREHPDVYGDGLALGNAEVTLLQLVQAYSALANRGAFRQLHYVKGKAVPARPVFSAQAASLIGNILSDPNARRLEFGAGSVLNLPVQTAVKTGTSSDYRDSWAVGYNDRYAAGVWMGNLDNDSTDGVTGSTGPGLVLRSVFARLNRNRETQPLYLSPQLVKKRVCRESGIPVEIGGPCRETVEEYFFAGRYVDGPHRTHPPVRIRQPAPGLHLAVDPRLPMEQQAFEFIVQGAGSLDAVEWFVDRRSVAETQGGSYLWRLRRGRHSAYAVVTRGGDAPLRTETVDFRVK